MNPEKLAKLQQNIAQVRIGGSGSARRKKKIVHKSTGTDDRKLQNALKKLGVNSINGIEEVNMIKDDGTVINFNNPKVQASIGSNTFSISGQSNTKQLTEMLPGILSQLGSSDINSFRTIAEQMKQFDVIPSGGKDDEIPDLVDNFEDASNQD